MWHTRRPRCTVSRQISVQSVYTILLDRIAGTAELADRDAVWVEDSGGPRNHVLDGVQIPLGRGNFGGKVCP